MIKIILNGSLCLSLLGTVEVYAAGAGDMANSTGVIGVASAVVSGYMAKFFYTDCKLQPKPTIPASCALAAMSAAQAGQSALSALDAFQTEKDVGGGPNLDPPPGFGDNPGWTDSSGLPPEFTEQNWGPFDTPNNFRKEVTKISEDLGKKGYNADLGTETLTDPSGKKYPLSALSSGKSMADAGLISADEIAAADANLKMYKDKFKTISMGIGGGGGGGSSSGSSASYAYNDPFADYLKSKKLDLGNAQTQGLTRTLASGESIGSQTDNIFQMIRRRYEKKKQEYVFVP